MFSMNIFMTKFCLISFLHVVVPGEHTLLTSTHTISYGIFLRTLFT